MEMRTLMRRQGGFVILFCVYFILAGTAMYASAEAGPGAHSGVKTAKAVFDFRVGQPGSALAHLTLVHNTIKELKAAGKSPDAVVVFIGPSVKLVSTAKNGFTADEQKTLDEIARTVTAMSKDGIRLEICMVAAKAFKVDPATILPEIKKEPNGWISLIKLQNQGYALVPAY